MSGWKPNSQLMEDVVGDSRSSRMASFDRRSRRKAPLARARAMRHHCCGSAPFIPIWFREVRVGEAQSGVGGGDWLLMALRLRWVPLIEEGSDHSSVTESIDSRGGTSDAEGEAEVLPPPKPSVPAVSVPIERFTDSFQWLAELDLEVVFKHRPCLMKSVPGFMKGAYRSAMRVALAEIDQGRAERDATRSSQGWKLFLLLPRLLLHKPPRGVSVPKKKLQYRFEVFAEGDRASLLTSSMAHASRAAQASSRRSRLGPAKL